MGARHRAAALACFLVLSGAASAGRVAGAASSEAADAPYLPELIARARALELARMRTWQVLVHYRGKAGGRWWSEADGLEFFVAGAAGRGDPEAELEATLTALFRPNGSAPDDCARCRFPARFAWLDAQLHFDRRRLPDSACPLFESWRRAIDAKGVTLVFATAYMNSPASMYGHTFLRFSRSAADDNALLDYAASFGADVDAGNGLAYAWKGLTGGFAGRFSVLPFYVKVQEYSNMENRDLWEYDLAFNGAQVERLIAHLWEIQATHFDYYFFTRNCSYQLLTLLEAGEPTLHLVDGFGARVIPSDTVKAVLARPGLVRATHGRPSLRTTMLRHRGALLPTEVNAAEALATSAEAAGLIEARADLRADRRALVLDTALDYVRYQRGERHVAGDPLDVREQALLLERGHLGVPSATLEVSPLVEAPEHAHPTFRVLAGAGFANQSGSFQTLGARGAIHDYLDPSAGYPEDAQLQMANIRIRYADRAETPARGALQLDRLDAIDILSAAPLSAWTRRPSWRVWAGADNARELGCEAATSDRQGWRCLYGGVSSGAGAAGRYGPGRAIMTYALGALDLGAGPAFAHAGSYRVGGGVVAGATVGVGRLRLELDGQALFYALGERRHNVRFRAANALFLGRALELRFSASSAGSYHEAAGELAVYF